MDQPIDEMEQEAPEEEQDAPEEAQQPAEDFASTSRRRSREEFLREPITNEMLLQAIHFQNQIAAQTERQHKAQHDEMMNVMNWLEQRQVNQGERIDDMVEEMTALSVEVNNLYHHIHHEDNPDNAPQRGRGGPQRRGGRRGQ